VSGSLWWTRPPVEPERDGAGSGLVDSLLAELLFQRDTSTPATRVIEPGDVEVWHLRGALWMAERLLSPAESEEVAADLRRLLKVVDTYGQAVVKVTRD
jgi:hypothetical protein